MPELNTSTGTETWVYVALTILLGAVVSAYTLLVLLSPALVVPSARDRTFRLASTHDGDADEDKRRPLPSVHDAPEVDLTVVVPAYNETARMPDMLRAALDHLESTAASTAKQNGKAGKSKGGEKKRRRTYEVLIVDDGSADDTSAVALRFAREYAQGSAKVGGEIRVVTLERNLGKGGAVRHGMLHGRGRRLLMVDADGASRFEDLEALWAAMDRMEEAHGEGEQLASVAIGSRAHLVKTEAVVKRSVLRNILMYGLHTILRLVGVGHIRDTQCGFKLFSRRAAQLVFPYQHLSTWIFDVEVLLLAKQLGVPVAEVPIEWHEVGGSKLNVVTDSVQMLRDLVVLRANIWVGRWAAPPPSPASTRS